MPRRDGKRAVAPRSAPSHSPDSTTSSRLVHTTAEVAYATNGTRRIVALNRAAERLLGFREPEVLGRPCYEVLRGTDRFGNRFCDRVCPLANMARRREPVADFEISVRDRAGRVIPAMIAAMVVQGPAPSDRIIVHNLKPLASRDRRSSRARRRDPTPRASASRKRDTFRLTPRELQVLRQLAAGKGTRDIAAALTISQATVRNHVKATLTKLGVHTRTAALASAYRHHLI